MQEVMALIVGLSVATERMVEITRSFVPLMNEKMTNPNYERMRKAGIQVHAALAGIFVAYLAQPMISGSLPEGWNTTTSIIVVGLLASGGSGFWNKLFKLVSDLSTFKRTGLQSALTAVPNHTAKTTVSPQS